MTFYRKIAITAAEEFLLVAESLHMFCQYKSLILREGLEDLTTCMAVGRQTVDTQGGIEFGGRGLEERDRGLLNDHEALLLTFIQGLELGAFAKRKEIVIKS